jgi:hypothetical protein
MRKRASNRTARRLFKGSTATQGAKILARLGSHALDNLLHVAFKVSMSHSASSCYTIDDPWQSCRLLKSRQTARDIGSGTVGLSDSTKAITEVNSILRRIGAQDVISVTAVSMTISLNLPWCQIANALIEVGISPDMSAWGRLLGPIMVPGGSRIYERIPENEDELARGSFPDAGAYGPAVQAGMGRAFSALRHGGLGNHSAASGTAQGVEAADDSYRDSELRLE